MTTKKLHIVSFDVPFPPNYGGAIDVFYKLKELHQLGVQIHLHCFEYGRNKQPELEQYCEKIYYYKRNSYLKSLFSSLPFVVKSRANRTLIKNIEKTAAPILFEGLHTTYPLLKRAFTESVFVRAHNIEHDYYTGLALSESNIFKRIFYLQEAYKLSKYERVLKKARAIFSISPFEQTYFSQKFGAKAIYIPAFHLAEKRPLHSSKGTSVLYHGDLRISDNIQAVLFLIKTYQNTEFTLVIASSFENASLQNELKKHQNMRFETIDTPETLHRLFEEAHIHVLLSFQKTGIKLKLLNSLYRGRFIIANTPMVEDTGLETLCKIANTTDAFLKQTTELFQQEFLQSETQKRDIALAAFNPATSAKKMFEIIFKQ